MFGKRQVPLTDYFSFTDAIEGGKTIPGGRDFTLFPPINQTSTDHVSPFREIGNGPLPTRNQISTSSAYEQFSSIAHFIYVQYCWLILYYIKLQTCYTFEVKSNAVESIYANFLKTDILI